MTAMPDFDRRITDWLKADATTGASGRVLAATLDRVAKTPQERRVTPWAWDIQPRSMRLAWGAVTVALLLGLLMVAALGVGRAPADPWPLGGDPVLSWARVPDESLNLRADPPSEFGRSNTRIDWLGDRFIVVDEDTSTVATSLDGLAWTTIPPGHPDRGYFEVLRSRDGGSGVISSYGDIVAVAPPGRLLWPGSPDAAIPDAQRAAAVGIGPAGIVVRTHSAIDFDAVVTRHLGAGWVEVLERFESKGEIVTVTTTDGREARIDVAAEGLEEGDIADHGFGWYSRDGVEWTAIEDFPWNVDAIVGTPEGFLARAFQERYGIWYSRDGLTWRELGEAGNGQFLPWRDGALLTDGLTRFEAWTDVGMIPLPIDISPIDDPEAQGLSMVNTGPLGLVVLDHGRRQVVVSPDGARWTERPMDEAMIAASGSARGPEAAIAVGATRVLVLLWEGIPEGDPRPSLWIGTPGAQDTP